MERVDQCIFSAFGLAYQRYCSYRCLVRNENIMQLDRYIGLQSNKKRFSIEKQKWFFGRPHEEFQSVKINMKEHDNLSRKLMRVSDYFWIVAKILAKKQKTIWIVRYLKKGRNNICLLLCSTNENRKSYRCKKRKRTFRIP